ncbi:MAG: DUF2520 domain-containing protein [Paludibacteraceae bacterium]|nr:DUF2520 domain-containing protein [Paludibacteraceae bacterium]
MRIIILGAGSVGTNLHHAFKLKGIRTELVHARPLTADPAAVEALPEADVYIYAIADQALREVISKVNAPRALHLHTSGSMPISVFKEDKPHSGILYFFQSFSREVMIDDWSSIPCFIEGHNIDDIAAIYSLAQCLTSHIYEADQHDRERLHIAGVFANNYTNLMYRIAADILKDTQIPFEALLPLIDNTAAKIHKIAPADAQTGPAQRGDEAVMKHHLEVLSNAQCTMHNSKEDFSSEELCAVYQALAALIGKAQNH